MSGDPAGAALDPTRSVVVEACAGSGKTWLLVSRILRLLLDGAEPSQILAITFTRKASVEMATRLRQWLRELACADDATVAAMLAERGLDASSCAAVLPRARRLLELTTEAAPGITVSTFHGWFLGLVQRALPEDGAAGAVLAESTSPLVHEAWRGFVDRVGSGRELELQAAFDRLVDACDLSNARRLLDGFLHSRAEWWAFTREADDALAHAAAVLARQCGVDADSDLLAPLAADAQLRAQLALHAEMLATSELRKDLACAAAARTAADGCPGRAWFDAACRAVFAESGRGAPLVYKDSAAARGRFGVDGLSQLQTRHAWLAQQLGEARQRLAEQHLLRVNLDLFRCGQAFIEEYQRAKASRNVLDFTDVEWRVLELVTASGGAEYLLHKLDSRFRHILVDEFQDTNPLQWRILLSWIRASAEAGSHPRLFFVGDPKQSIYRFRRADPRLFRAAREFVVAHYDAEVIEQHRSWRCATPVLDVVNAVFAGLDGFDGFVPHVAQRVTLPGRVELLPLAPALPDAADTAAADDALRNPLTRARPGAAGGARTTEAGAVAERIRGIVGCWRIAYEGGTRPARWSDVMILVRTRRHLPDFEAALRERGIPFLTSRHGGLLDRLESIDLQSLLRFLVTPFADLDLARALRSPLFSCTDNDLIALAGQPGAAWWHRLQALVTAGEPGRRLERAHALLSRWLPLADRLPVHDLLDRIYFEGDLLRRYRAAVPAALAETACANLLAFMELALSIDAGRYPSLPGFVHALEQMRDGADEEAPDEGVVETGDDAVRLLTIHGAKGLEAPVVFLVDTHRLDRADSHEVLVDWPSGEDRPVRVCARTRAEEDVPSQADLLARERDAARREELNALYVALTRARQGLVVSGTAPGRGDPPDTWYRRVEVALDGQSFLGQDLDAGAGSVGVQVGPSSDDAASPEEGLGPIAPVGTRGNEDATPATERGERIHWLLEQLSAPDPVGDEGWLQDRLDVPEAVFRADLAQARSVLATPALQGFFDPDRYRWARNEVAYVGSSGEMRRMDRVVLRDDGLWVLDYKTGATALDELADDAPHLAQMREYRAAAERLWPAHAVRTALIDLEGRLHEIGPGATS
jgi:ATP-dependent helicase/nuclease subunit A